MGIDRVIVFVAESVGTNRKMFAFPADSLRLGIYPEDVKGKAISTVSVNPEYTVKIMH